MKRAAFLFGSGISLASDAPSVKTISDALLYQGWHDEGEFRFSRSDTGSTGTALRAQKFLRILKSYIDTHLILRENRDAHYEDLYAAAMQIFEDETLGNVEPMLRHSVAEIRSSVASLYQDQEAGNYLNAFARLVHSGIRLIHWGVYHLLWPAETPVGMEAISSVAKATQQMDIFSLNHDLLIERQLESSGQLFADGFSEKDGDVTKFDWSWNSHIPIHLYKLHGSLDWYRLTCPGGVDQFAKVPRNVDPRKCQNAAGDGLVLQPTNEVPLLLIGTTGKEQLYGAGIIGEIFLPFLLRLREHRTLICCGYGWSDKGINKRLCQWVQNSGKQNLGKNRIVILHDSTVEPLDKLKQKQFWSKKDRQGSRWDNWEQSGQLVVVPKWLDSPGLTLSDLEPFFDDFEQ
jgi:hypothetical protein